MSIPETRLAPSRSLADIRAEQADNLDRMRSKLAEINLKDLVPILVARQVLRTYEMGAVYSKVTEYRSEMNAVVALGRQRRPAGQADRDPQDEEPLDGPHGGRADSQRTDGACRRVAEALFWAQRKGQLKRLIPLRNHCPKFTVHNCQCFKFTL